MGWYLRKSVRSGPVRLNVSKSGIGVSAGVKGARVGIGPRGLYVAGGLGGPYFFQRLASAGRKGRGSGASPLAVMAGVAALVAMAWYVGRAFYRAFYYCVTIPWLSIVVAAGLLGIGVVTHSPEVSVLSLAIAAGAMLVQLSRIIRTGPQAVSESPEGFAQSKIATRNSPTRNTDENPGPSGPHPVGTPFKRPVPTAWSSPRPVPSVSIRATSAEVSQRDCGN